MKTNYLKVGLMALAVVGALFPSRSEAAASFEEVGYYYGRYLESILEVQYQSNYPDITSLVPTLERTYGATVAYYFYYEALIDEVYDSIYQIVDPQTAYYRYLGALYSYYFSPYPGYSDLYEEYFDGYVNALYSNYYAYAEQLAKSNEEAQDYLRSLIFPGEEYYY